jgi:hypothetical protein
MENHADAHYNLGLTELELIYDICDDDAGLSTDWTLLHVMLVKPLDILSTVIANDTSKRGETTGLAHRIVANVYCRYYKAVNVGNAPFNKFFEQIKIHISASVIILANHPDLDTLMFESCQLLHGMMSAYMEEAGNSDLTVLIVIIDIITFLRRQVDDCLQTPQSSGIDLEVKLLDGAVLIDVMGYLVNAMTVRDALDKKCKVQFLREQTAVMSFMQNCIAAALSLHDALISFVPDDSEVQTVAGDLIQSAIELHDTWSAVCGGDTADQNTVFRMDEEIGHKELDLHEWLSRLINCRCIVTLQDPSANNLLALGDDLKAIGELLDSDGSSQGTGDSDAFVEGVLELLAIAESNGLDTLLGRQNKSLLTLKASGSCLEAKSDEVVGRNGKGDCDCSHASASLPQSLSTPIYARSRKCYESALIIYHSKTEDGEGGDEDDDEEPDNLSAIHYNLLCVLWKMKGDLVSQESDIGIAHNKSCKDQFSNYLAIEIQRSSSVSDGDGGDNKGVDGSSGDMIIRNVMADADLDGISDCAWFTEVLHEFNIHFFE